VKTATKAKLSVVKKLPKLVILAGVGSIALRMARRKILP
jgi:hypothetical protein